MGAVEAPMIDVDVYLAGGSALLQGQNLYVPETGAHNLPYLYTPFAAVLFAPFNYLSTTTVHVVFTIVLVLATAALAYFSLKRFAPKSLAWQPLLATAAVFGAAVLLEPVSENFRFGQINLLLGALVVADLVRPASRVPRGVLIGLAAAVKLTPLLFAVYFLGSRRVREGAVIVATFVACSVIGLLAAWRSSIDYWSGAMFDTSGVGVAFITNQSLNGVASRLADGPQLVPLLVKLAIISACGAATLVAIYAARNGRTQLGDLLCGTVILLLSPISWSHHWVWAVPVLVWLGLGDRSRWRTVAAILGFLLFAVSPLRFVPSRNDREFDHSFGQALLGNSYAIVAVVFVVACFVTVGRRRSTSRGFGTVTEPA